MSVKINNRVYAWGDIKVVMWGRVITSITEIAYKTTKEKEERYGAGRNALSIQHGRRKNEGTIAVGQDELIAMNAAARSKGFKDILDAEADIVVTYLPEDGVVFTTDIIRCASFSEFNSGMKEGDKKSEHPLAFLALDIDYDAASVI